MNEDQWSDILQWSVPDIHRIRQMKLINRQCRQLLDRRNDLWCSILVSPKDTLKWKNAPLSRWTGQQAWSLFQQMEEDSIDGRSSAQTFWHPPGTDQFWCFYPTEVPEFRVAHIHDLWHHTNTVGFLLVEPPAPFKKFHLVLLHMWQLLYQGQRAFPAWTPRTLKLFWRKSSRSGKSVILDVRDLITHQVWLIFHFFTRTSNPIEPKLFVRMIDPLDPTHRIQWTTTSGPPIPLHPCVQQPKRSRPCHSSLLDGRFFDLCGHLTSLDQVATSLPPWPKPKWNEREDVQTFVLTCTLSSNPTPLVLRVLMDLKKVILGITLGPEFLLIQKCNFNPPLYYLSPLASVCPFWISDTKLWILIFSSHRLNLLIPFFFH